MKQEKDLIYLVNECKQLNNSNKSTKVYGLNIHEFYKRKIEQFKDNYEQLEFLQKEIRDEYKLEEKENGKC